jgi:hypothetical protein
MGWELFLPHPADFLLGPIIRWFRKRRAPELEMQARTWPRAQGNIYECRAKRVQEPPDGWHTWQAEVTFSYVVEGEYYSGKSSLPPETEDEVSEQVQRWTGRKVIVRYSPEDVSKAMLLPADQT